MRNTGIEYNSADRSPVVLPEMAQLLPPLTGEQLAALDADLLANGCYSPIIVNEDMVIIDGHNRQELCEKHGIPYKMAVFSFTDIEIFDRAATDGGVEQTIRICYRFGGYIGERCFKAKVMKHGGRRKKGTDNEKALLVS